MPSALIGYTGFVGSNLLRQTHFDDLYNSKNIEDIRGKEYDLVVCAAPRADKWWANANPEKDFSAIHSMFFRGIESVQAKRFIHISTIDVYSNPVGVDEDSVAGAEGVSPYGKNRYWLEGLIRVRFPHAQIIRLPGLFGPGLKKNLIYDLIHGDYRFLPQPESTFQFYNVNNLWRDISQNTHLLVNFATWPKRADVIASMVRFPVGQKSDQPEVHYDVRTKYGGPYWDDEGENNILQQLLRFAKDETRAL